MSAECRCSTVQDGSKYLDLKPSQPLTAVEECGTRRADNVSHLNRWRIHLLGLRRLTAIGKQGERIERTGSSIEMPLGNVQIDRGFFQAAVAKQ